MSARGFIILGALLAAAGVAAGAFGAHGLRALATPERIEVFETAAWYHQIHAVAIVVVGVIAMHRPSARLSAAGYLLVAGVILFSGSLYTLVLTDAGWWGAVTPFGGVAFIAGWTALAWATLGWRPT